MPYRMRQMMNRLDGMLRTRTCRRCLLDKPVTEFIEGSNWCDSCRDAANKEKQ